MKTLKCKCGRSVRVDDRAVSVECPYCLQGAPVDMDEDIDPVYVDEEDEAPEIDDLLADDEDEALEDEEDEDEE